MSFLSVTGRDLNRESAMNLDPHATPSKKSAAPSRILYEKELVLEFGNDSSNTLTDDRHNDRHFERISDRVNTSIGELKLIYNAIGYSSTETAIKSSEIFSAIEDSITQFVLSLQREKGNIENECEWLRQQIRIILAMIDDPNGEKILSLSRQGLVYNDITKYEQGFREEILDKLKSIEQKKSGFYASSPFNISSTTDGESLQFQNQYQELLQNVPRMTLLQQKNSLNRVFLYVLEKFVDIFGSFNDLNLIRQEIIDVVGRLGSDKLPPSFLDSLPSKADSEMFKDLISNFHKITSTANMAGSLNETDSFEFNQSKDNAAFIISSPRKNDKLSIPLELDSAVVDHQEKPNREATMNALRDINYKLVRAIRGLKITKLTYTLIDEFQEEVESNQILMNTRMLAMHEIIDKAFEFVDLLHLSDEQFMALQKKFDLHKVLDSEIEAIDTETLKFIQKNPKEFGLSDKHFEYVNRIVDILQKLKDNRQTRWDFYHDSCVPLWERLGELQEFMVEFVTRNADLTDSSILNFKHEYARLCSKRSEFVDSFIADARTDIHNMWKALKMTRNQCSEFKHYDYDSHSRLDKEIVLQEHEAELKRLQEEFKSKENILKLNQQLNDLLEDQTFLRESSKDSARLLSKNSCKILLNEEKLRKKIIKLLPNTLKQLKEEVVKYNNEQLNKGLKPMTMDGEDFFERLIVIESENLSSGVKKLRPLNNAKFSRQSSPNKVLKSNPNRSPIVNKSPSRSSPLYAETKRQPRRPLTATNSVSPKKTTDVRLAPLSQPLTVRNVAMVNKNVVHSDAVSSFSETSMASIRNSPARTVATELSDPIDDKENSFSLSPIKTSDFMFESRREEMLQNSSTFIGDDYQRWRNEKIKQLNGMG